MNRITIKRITLNRSKSDAREKRSQPSARRAEKLSNKRNGWTLVQVLVTSTLLTTMSYVIIQLMSMMLRIERDGVGHVVQLDSLARISRQFRHDAHQARSCDRVSERAAQSVLLKLANGHIVIYRAEPRRVLRIEMYGDVKVRQESYRLPDSHLELKQQMASQPLVTLIVGQGPPHPMVDGTGQSVDRKSHAVYQIEARLGRDLPAEAAVKSEQL